MTISFVYRNRQQNNTNETTIGSHAGIFISRMHDDAASSSLTGLLSIGDRILAIDDCPIEPDYDILKVNQMISKKTKILLKVKPFKG